MTENGLEFGIRLAVAAFAIVGLACMLFVGVAAAVLLALGRRSYRGGYDDAADDRQDYQHIVAAEKSVPTMMPRGGAGASSNGGSNSPAAVAASAPSRCRIM